MRRAEVDQHRARYAVSRPRWDLIAYAVCLRLALAILGALVGVVAIGQGWI